MRRRIEWIDNARGLCMLFVMAHHTGLADVWLLKIYLPIFLTLFFFISGYLFINPDKEVSIAQKCLNIVTSLIIPYALYCTLTSVFNLLTGGCEAFLSDIKISLFGVKSWFISALVVTEIFAIPTVGNKKYRIALCVAYLSISLLIYFNLPYQEYFWNFRNAMFANVYFAIGMLCRYYNVTSYILKNKVGGWLLLIYATFVIIDIQANVNVGNFNESFSNYPFFIAESLCGIPAFAWLCSKMTRYNTWLMFIGANSLLFYLFQSVVIRGALGVFARFGLHTTNGVDLLIILLTVCLCITILVFFINKYLPVFSGKYRIKIKGKG